MVSLRVTLTLSVPGECRYVSSPDHLVLGLLIHQQAKGGYKTRKVNKPNKWVVTPRVRNQGKRRAK